MKSALKRFDTYLYAFILLVIGFVPFFIQMIFYFNPSSGLKFQAYPIFMWVAIALYFLLGIIIPDIYSFRKRKKINDWDNQLPKENLLIMWRIKTPLWLACAVLLVYCLTVEIILKVTIACGGVAHYPFL